MPDNISPDQARRDLDAKLSGLERLRLAGLVTEERYVAMRDGLIAQAQQAAAPPQPAPAAPASPEATAPYSPPTAPPAAPATPAFSAYTPPSPAPAAPPVDATRAAPEPATPTPTYLTAPPTAAPAEMRPAVPQPPTPTYSAPLPPAPAPQQPAAYTPPQPAAPSPTAAPKYVPPAQRAPEPPPASAGWSIRPPAAQTTPPAYAAAPPPQAPPQAQPQPAWPQDPFGAPPPQMPAAGPQPKPPSRSRGGLMIAVAAAVVLLGSGTFAAVVLRAHNPSATNTAANAGNTSASSSATPTPTPEDVQHADMNKVRADYLAAMDPLNQSWINLDNAFKSAESKPCPGCPPGTFDITPVIPALEGVVVAYQSSIDGLSVIEAQLEGQPSSDVGALINAERRSLVAFENELNEGGSSTIASGLAGTLVQANKDAQTLDNTVRKEIGLTQTAPLT